MTSGDGARGRRRRRGRSVAVFPDSLQVLTPRPDRSLGPRQPPGGSGVFLGRGCLLGAGDPGPPGGLPTALSMGSRPLGPPAHCQRLGRGPPSACQRSPQPLQARAAPSGLVLPSWQDHPTTRLLGQGTTLQMPIYPLGRVWRPRSRVSLGQLLILSGCPKSVQPLRPSGQPLGPSPPKAACPSAIASRSLSSRPLSSSGHPV